MYTPTQRLMRSRTDRMLAGVAGGIGQYLAVDPVFVRLALVALGFTGVGVLLYPVLWLVMPLESGRDMPLGTQAARPGNGDREVFVAPSSTARRVRFDPMTGEPADPEGEIPINNLNPGGSPPTDPARRNRLLGMILVGVGAFVLLTMIPGFGMVIERLLFPALLIGAGVLLLRRSA